MAHPFTTSAVASSPVAEPRADELAIRLLCPFHHQGVRRTIEALRHCQWRDKPVWEDEKDGDTTAKRALPNPNYLEELQPQMKQFLFGSDGDESWQGYLRLSHRCENDWFGNRLTAVLNGEEEERWERRSKNTEAAGPRPPSVVLHLDRRFGVEVFLSSCGAGVLSVSLLRSSHDQLGGFTDAEIQDTVYHLSHLKYRVPVLRQPHRETDPQLSAERNEQPLTYPAPLADESGRDRQLRVWRDHLGKPGLPFTLPDLLDGLLGPTENQGVLRRTQSQLLVHTVVLFPCSPGLTDPEQRPRYVRLLAALAQLEESMHAPIPDEDAKVDYVALDTHHLVAVSTLGACHCAADQWPRNEDGVRQDFDAQRLHKLTSKHFVAYLAALLQRVALLHFRQQAATLATTLQQNASSSAHGRQLQRLHLDVSCFAAAGVAADVSRRRAVNRFYALAQEALHITRGLSELHASLRDIASAESSRADREHLERLSNTQDKVALMQQEVVATQHKLEWIELFIVTFYAYELVHQIDASVSVRGWLKIAAPIVAGMLGGLTVWLFAIRAVQQPWRRVWTSVVLAAVVLWVLGLAWSYGQPPQEPNSEGAATAPASTDRPDTGKGH